MLVYQPVKLTVPAAPVQDSVWKSDPTDDQMVAMAHAVVEMSVVTSASSLSPPYFLQHSNEIQASYHAN